MPPKKVEQEEADDFEYAIGKDYFGSLQGRKMKDQKAIKAKQDEKKVPDLRPISHAVDKLLELPHTGKAPAGIKKKLSDIRSLALAGFSILIHGVGSKIDIMSQLVEDHLKDFYVVQIHGFQQTLSLSRCLIGVLQTIFKKPLPRQTTVDILTFEIAKYAGDKPIAWVVDSIDAPALRQHQEALSVLATTGLFIASADHVRFGLSWDESMNSKFNWVYQRLDTFEDYRREVIGIHGGCLPSWCGISATHETAASQSLAVVLRSLTPHHASLLKLVAKLQLKSTSNYVKQSDLLRESRREMLATNHAKLKSLLHELIDHAIIKTKKEQDTGNEVFYITGEKVGLEKIVSGEALVDSMNAHELHRGA